MLFPGVRSRRRGSLLTGAACLLLAASSAAIAQAPSLTHRLACYVLEPLAGHRTRVLVMAEIDSAGLKTHAGARPELRLRVEATPRDGTQPIARELSLAGGPEASGAHGGATPLSAQLELALDAGVHDVRAEVHDPASGLRSVVEQSVAVPDPASFYVSTPVLSDEERRSPDQASLPEPVARDAFEAAGRPLLAWFEVFGAARDPTTRLSRVEAWVVLQDRSGRLLAAPPPSALVPAAEGRLYQVAAVPRLPAGEYELVISVRDGVSGASREERRAFRIQEPPGAIEPAQSPAQALSPELAGILERAGRYVLGYAQQLHNVLAEEACHQVFEPDDPVRRVVRDIRAGVVFVHLAGPVPWATFRDVWEVDGSTIGDRQDRLLRLFQSSPATAAERARAILAEASRFNLGPVRRTLNLPTLALAFLLPENRSRFGFELKERRPIAGATYVRVEFRELRRPTLVAADSPAGAPVKGSLWIDPESGSVVKTDADYDIDPRDPYHRSRARVVTDYRHDAALGILVPSEMLETYQSLAAQHSGFEVLPDARSRSKDARDESAVLTVRATTRYSGYRRFAVSTEEAVTGVREPPR
jgi:hypothetical protein